MENRASQSQSGLDFKSVKMFIVWLLNQVNSKMPQAVITNLQPTGLLKKKKSIFPQVWFTQTVKKKERESCSGCIQITTWSDHCLTSKIRCEDCLFEHSPPCMWVNLGQESRALWDVCPQVLIVLDLYCIIGFWLFWDQGCSAPVLKDAAKDWFKIDWIYMIQGCGWWRDKRSSVSP